MPLKTVLKVNIPCDKCKKEVLRAVTSLEGVDKVEVDADKGTLIVIGEADPYDIVMITRKKAGKYAQFVTVGPPPKPEEPKKPVEEKPKCPCPCPYPYPYPGFQSSSYWDCKPVAVMTMDYQYQDPVPPCSIM